MTTVDGVPPDNPALGSIAPLARFEFDRLLECRNAPDVMVWVTRNASRARRRERVLLELLAGAVAVQTFDGSAFYRLELDEATTTSSALAGRLVTAISNRDDVTLASLVDAWAASPVAERAAVLEELAFVLTAGR